MLQLRDYQQEALEAIWAELYRSNSALCAMATGSGKSEIFIALIKMTLDLKSDAKIVVLLNKVSLLDQTVRRIVNVIGEERVGVFCGSRFKYETKKPVIIASIQSVFNAYIGNVNLLILDEAHNIDHESGRYLDFISKLRFQNDKLKIVGFTATPFRSTGHIYGSNKMFKRVSYERGLKKMIDEGYLVEPKLKKVLHQFDTTNLKVVAGEFSPKDVEALTSDEKVVSDQVKDALSRMQDRACVVWACSSIDHAERVHKILTLHYEEKAVVLHSKLRDVDRLYAQNMFEKHSARHMVFVSIVSEGYDFPPIDCVVLMRPIKSPVLYAQTVGRALRPYAGKKDALILDYGSVVETCGPLDNPFVPTKGQRTKALPDDFKMRFCKTCLSYMSVKLKYCTDCGAEFVNANARVERLAKKAATEGEILTTPRVIKIKDVKLMLHTSRKTNKPCVRISYIHDSFLPTENSEYYRLDLTWRYKQLLQRLEQLNVDLKVTPEEQVLQTVKRIPKSIIVLGIEIEGISFND